MHIGLTTSVIQRGQSGIAQYVFALVRELIKNTAHRYTLFALEEDLGLFDFAAEAANLTTVSESFRQPLKNMAWHQTILPGLARRLGLDVLHVPSYRRMLWPRPCPLVATIHDLAQFHIPRKYSWPRMFYGRNVVPRLARRQDEIVVISHNTARDVGRFLKVPDERLTVVYNGVDHSRFFPGGGANARQFGLDRPFFLYVARLEHPGKNHCRLISAFNRFKGATGSKWILAFAGGDWHGADQIHQAIRESQFGRDIRCLGFVPDIVLPELYRAAEVFVYPSLFEGFGMPPIEAMACGCPVISSDRGSLGEILGDAAVRVDPENIDSLTERLCSLSSDASLRREMRSAGLKQAQQFDWAGTTAATVKVYERAVSRV